MSAGFFLSNSRFCLDRSELKIIIVFFFVVGEGRGRRLNFGLVSLGSSEFSVALFELLLAQFLTLGERIFPCRFNVGSGEAGEVVDGRERANAVSRLLSFDVLDEVLDIVNVDGSAEDPQGTEEADEYDGPRSWEGIGSLNTYLYDC